MAPPPPASDPYYDLGKYRRTITTSNPDCQEWFNRGLIWTYAFAHEGAATCFEKAIAHDPTCPMAYWGLAYASGPNYNKSWQFFDPEDLKASLKKTTGAAADALKYIDNGTPLEKALVKAIPSRFQSDVPPENTDDFSRWNVDYADAMKVVYEEFGDDLDVAALYADAMMNITPWSLWDLKTGKPPKGTRTLQSKAVLEKAFKTDSAWSHPGLLHLYVHMIEMSPQPELGLPHADRLRNLTPDAGHLRHMPSHLDILVGDYRRAIDANAQAIVADNAYLKNMGLNNLYSVYRAHDFDSLVYAAMFAGQIKVAMNTVDEMEAAIPEWLLKMDSPPMADWLETFLSVRPHVLIRFGKWDDILALELPTDKDLYCVTVATIHYARGVAYAARGEVDKSAAEQQLFEEACKRVPDSRMDFPNKCNDVLAVGKQMLAGELEYRRGNTDKAFEHLQKALDLDDNLIYSEPWAWKLPVRHAWAALLLEAGQVEKAAKLYRADLGYDSTLPRGRQHPRNVWALHGYHECLRKLGKQNEADLLDLDLKVAIAVADIEVESSCFCRINTEKPKDSEGKVLLDQASANGCCANGD